MVHIHYISFPCPKDLKRVNCDSQNLVLNPEISISKGVSLTEKTHDRSNSQHIQRVALNLLMLIVFHGITHFKFVGISCGRKQEVGADGTTVGSPGLQLWVSSLNQVPAVANGGRGKVG